MATVRVSQFNVPTTTNTQAFNNKVSDHLTQFHDSSTFALGTQIQNPSIIQLTSQGSGAEILQTAHSLLGEPQRTFTITLNKPIFGPSNAPAQGPILEFVQSWFPVSRLTPDFMSTIEEDFERFHASFRRTAVERLGTAYGWSEEVDHNEIGGEKARAFAVLVGWWKMSDFEESISRDGFKEGLPILMAWGAPVELVSLGRVTWRVEDI